MSHSTCGRFGIHRTEASSELQSSTITLSESFEGREQLVYEQEYEYPVVMKRGLQSVSNCLMPLGHGIDSNEFTDSEEIIDYNKTPELDCNSIEDELHYIDHSAAAFDEVL